MEGAVVTPVGSFEARCLDGHLSWFLTSELTSLDLAFTPTQHLDRFPDAASEARADLIRWAPEGAEARWIAPHELTQTSWESRRRQPCTE